MAHGRPVPPVEVRALEANAVALGVSIDQMMENAGHAVAEEAKKHLPSPPAPVGILCGLGNNGGDGLAAATFLAAEGYQPRVWLLDDPAKIRTAAALRRWELVKGLRYARVGVPTAGDLVELPLVIDAMLGTGGQGPPRAPYSEAIRAVSSSGVKVLSVDLPTGLGSDSVLEANWTVSLEVLKEGMEAHACGEVVVRSIGMPEQAHAATGIGEFVLYRAPAPSTQKSDSGRVVVIGGGPYAGAPCLAGLGALRSGADMVFVIVPEGVEQVVQSFSPQLIVRGVGSGRRFRPEDLDALTEQAESLRPSALLIGNGIGDDPGTLELCGGLLERVLPAHPCVVDADGLRALSSRSDALHGGRSPSQWLLTPNRREFAHLAREASGGEGAPDPEAVRATAQRWKATVLSKGLVDTISDGTEVRLNRTHHPAMVVGGAGDVLAGVAVGLLSAGLTPFQAARLASYWLGRASMEVFDQVSYALLPEDLLRHLGPTLRRALEELRRLTDPGRPSRPAQA